MKITVDRGRCASLGLCESLAPDVFELDDEGILAIQREDAPPGQRSLIERAVLSCPTSALTLTDD